MSHYDQEHFFDFEQYLKMEQAQPIPILPNHNKHVFDFYQIPFQNGVHAYLFKEFEQCENFVFYMGFVHENCPFYGKISDCEDRILTESVKRNTNDFLSLCEQLAKEEDRPYVVIYSPFKMSYMKQD